MKEIGIGFFEKNPYNQEKVYNRLVKAAKELGCVTTEEINFGVDCLRKIVELRPKKSFDELAMREYEYDVMYLKRES